MQIVDFRRKSQGISRVLIASVLATCTTQSMPGAKQSKIGTVGINTPASHGTWLLDQNGNNAWDGTPTDGAYFWSSGQANETFVYGDWNGDGRTKIGVYFNGTWLLDFNGNGVWDEGVDKRYAWGGDSTYSPIVGDWNGDGRTKIGLYSTSGVFLLDYNGNGVWDGTTIDRTATWSSGTPGDKAVIGDWNGDGRAKIGIYTTAGNWLLDYNGNYMWDPGGDQGDKVLNWTTQTGGTPMVGDWNGDGRTKIGVYQNGTWIVDYNGNYAWDEPVLDRLAFFGGPGYDPMVGDWNGSGTTKIGAYYSASGAGSGTWAIDFNGNWNWELPPDILTNFGGPGEKPVVGKWPQGDFQPIGFISSSPASQTIVQGGTAQYQLTVTPPAGFTGTMVLSTSALPAGASANFSPASLTVPGSGASVLTIGTNGANTPPSTYPITVTASRLGITNAQTTVTVIVTAPVANVPSSSTVIPFGWVSHAETLMFTTDTHSGTAPSQFSVVIENAGTYENSSTTANQKHVVSAHACYVVYLAPGYGGPNTGDLLVLGPDDGSANWVNPGGTTPGTQVPVTGTQNQISNSQCTLDTSRSYVQRSGTAMTLHLALTFFPTWNGPKEIFVDTSDLTPEPNMAVLSWTNRGSWTVPATNAIPVTTDHYDVFRTGANVHETTLTPTFLPSLTPKASFPLDGCAWAQPLYVPNLTINGVVHQVLYVATSNATIYAYDAESTSTIPFWTRSLGTPKIPAPTDDIWNCNTSSTVNAPEGIIGTPVIDLSSNTMYVVASLQSDQHKLFGIDIISGAIKLGPIVIASTVSPTFDAIKQNQRPGLLLADYSVLFGYASYGDGKPYRGWMFNYSRDNLVLADNWPYSTDVDRGGTGIWMSGGGPAFDGTKVYFSTGNNVDIDENHPTSQLIGLSNSLLQVDPHGGPVPGTMGSGLALINTFRPPQAASWVNTDRDLGSSRVIVVPGTNSVLVGGKAGNIYLVDRTVPAPGNPLTLTSPEFNLLGSTSNGYPEISGGLAYWNGTIYTWAGTGDQQLGAFSLAAPHARQVNSDPSVKSNKVTVGEQGAPISISANFDTNGLLWAIFPTALGDAHLDPRGKGTLLVYDVTDLSAPKMSYSLENDNVLKFTAPLVVNGRVFVATQGQPTLNIPPRVHVYAH